ncbi:unnamed protein product [Pocillopora meandrina]|uniref:Uncharacterized protein n=1 Tax=Pocillopora meandrina TaxID=46732 RepID=A0AAU9VUA5_9CNID|nr:unnamed protein product [Pocillopora meandrina]
MEHIPDSFFHEDVKIRGHQYLVFTSDKQLTFKLCQKPFIQLLTLNAFVKNDDHMKQVPLIFIIMSGRKRRDYKVLLDAVTSILPHPPGVTKVCWISKKLFGALSARNSQMCSLKGVHSTGQKPYGESKRLAAQSEILSMYHLLPQIREIQTCTVRFRTKLVQGLGIQDAYRNDGGTHQFIRQVMALPYLPAEKIEMRFHQLQQQATVRPLQDFCSYMHENWISSQTFQTQT